MDPFIEQIYREGTALSPEGRVVTVLPTGVPRSDGEALYRVVRACGAKETLEIGFAYGLSTLCILQALRENGGGHHTAIDPFEAEGYENVGLENVRRAGYDDLFTFHHTFSQDLLPQFLIEGRKFDFAFIDGHHTFDHVFMDFFYCDKLVRDGGLIMFHDMILPSVRKAVTFVLRNMNYELAMEPLLEPVSWWRRAYYTARLMRVSPTEPYSWLRLAPTWARSNVCVVRRLGPDTRNWVHYRSF